MKPNEVKIIQFFVEPKRYYQSNGSIYKNTVETHNVFGLGDDGKIYIWREHYESNQTREKTLGWKLYIPA